jgi:hypothetical protein
MTSYYVPNNQISTILSGGRKHYTFRDTIISQNTYPYKLGYGENFYTLAQQLMKSDTYWWVISDLNPAIDPFLVDIGDMIILAQAVISNTYAEPDIF